MYSICHVILQDYVTKGSWLYGWELLVVYHHPNNIGDNRYCNLGDLIVLVCQLTSRDHVLKGPCDVIEGNLCDLWYVTTLSKSVILSTVVMKI